jgi:hypothetical protein
VATPALRIDDEPHIATDRHGANLFLRLISRRYERGAIMRRKRTAA